MKQTYNLQPFGCCSLKHLRCVAHVDAEHVEEVMPVRRVCATCIAERQRRGSIACLDPVRIKEAGVVRACCGEPLENVVSLREDGCREAVVLSTAAKTASPTDATGSTGPKVSSHSAYVSASHSHGA